jgi:hypothetical protein
MYVENALAQLVYILPSRRTASEIPPMIFGDFRSCAARQFLASSVVVGSSDCLNFALAFYYAH